MLSLSKSDSRSDLTLQLQVFVMQLDLASMKSIRAFAEEYNNNKELPPLCALICNAGLQVITPAQTVEGIEMTFGVNHLGHFLLTNLLLKVRRIR